MNVTVTNNTILDFRKRGIFAQMSEDNPSALPVVPGTNRMNLTITNNTINNVEAVAEHAILMQAGAISGDAGQMNLVLTGNDAFSAGGNEIRVRATQSTVVNMPGYAGGATDNTAATNFVTSNNPLSINGAGDVISAAVLGSGTFTGLPSLLAAPGGVEAAGGGSPGDAITDNALAALADAAIARWAATGLSADQLAALDSVSIAVADLEGDQLGTFDNGQIILDVDAAGHGWFIDPTPADDLEFPNAANGTDLLTDPSLAPAGDMDLLTVLMHEMGHALGLDHDPANPHDLMSDTLVTGERRVPDAGDVAQATDTADAAEAALPAAPRGTTLVWGADPDSFVFDRLPQPSAQTAAAPALIAGHVATLGDAFDFSALFASLPCGEALEARLGQAFAEVKDAFVDLRDAHHGEHPFADFAVQLRDGPIGDILDVVLSRPTADPQADWLV